MSDSNLRRPILFSILAAVATLGLKFAAYLYTGSIGLLSDAAESSVNLIASVTAFASLWYSARPIDSTHTFGHKKIEYFSSGLEGALIVVAAFGIAWYAITRLMHPEPLEGLGVGLVVALTASLINWAVATWLLRVGKKHRSIVLEADGHHLMTDVWTSAALVAALALVKITGLEWLDPLLAIAMSINILRTGLGLVWRSFHGLLDHALPAEELALIRNAIVTRLPPGTTYHALRTRQAGSDTFVEFHFLVPGATSVEVAHRQGEVLEQSIREALAGTHVLVHIEPIEEASSWEDNVLHGIESSDQAS